MTRALVVIRFGNYSIFEFYDRFFALAPRDSWVLGEKKRKKRTTQSDGNYWRER